jgi:dipeptidyl aminopeptidase/acylaminoacyl peptidase
MLESSAINFIDKLPHSTKYFLIHGAKDERISIFDALEMYRNMLERNFSSRFLCFENGDHFLKKFRKELDFILVDWLNSKLN